MLAGFSFGQPPEPFTIVLLPDTQYYSDKYPDTFLAQTAWIKDHAKERNIKFVIHLGDIVDDGTNERQWKVADEAYRALDGAVPYSCRPGNHDMDDKRATRRSTTSTSRRNASRVAPGTAATRTTRTTTTSACSTRAA